MKNNVLFVLAVFFSQYAISQLNIDSIGHLDLNSVHSQNLNDIWGYTDEFGNEYALVGGTKGTSVVDVSTPSAPVEVLYEPGLESVWRDIKTWGDYAYVTTEALNGLLIIDLTALPAAGPFPTNIYTGPIGSPWQSAHNLYIDSSGYCYIFGADRGNGGVIILDLNTDPMNPIEVGVFDDWYVHDGFAYNDTLYLGHIYEGTMSVIDVQDRSNPVLLGTAPTPTTFAHNVWTGDGEFAFTTDEVSGGFIGAFDISDPANIVEIDRIQSSPGAGVIPHNTHVYQNYLVTSYYSDGVTVHDITHPYNLIEVGNYDTYPLQTTSYDGCWGVFPYFSSGLMVASDITGGLFVLSPTYEQAAYLEGIVTDASSLLPIDVVDVQLAPSNQPEVTNNAGFYATGFSTGGTYDITYSKVGYYPQTISVTISNGVITTQDVQLVPIPTFNLTVNVLDMASGSPVDAADVRLEATLITHDGVTNALGEESFALYYEEPYKVFVGKWGFVTSCDVVLIDNTTATLTVYIDSGYYDDFTFDFGWTTGGDALSGYFERGEPFGTTSGSNPDLDSDNDCSVNCYVTGNAPNVDPDFDDVVGGSVILRSPVMDLTGYTEPYLNYEWYFYNFHGPIPPFDDTLLITVSNGIVNDIVLQATGSDQALFFTWHEESKKLSDFITITSTMQFTFETSDYDPAVNITEAAIDHFFIAEEAELGIDVLETTFNLYPNPASSKITIESDRVADFAIISLEGKLVLEGNLSIGANSISTSGIENGIYYVQSGNKKCKLIITK